MIGCDCAVCRSSDPRDQRTRPSVYLELNDGLRVLVDTTPDLRSQALRHDIRRVDAILFTHAHADHIMGLDEVRRFNMLTRRAMPVFADARTLAALRRTFGYVFDSDAPKGGGVPHLLDELQVTAVHAVEVAERDDRRGPLRARRRGKAGERHKTGT